MLRAVTGWCKADPVFGVELDSNLSKVCCPAVQCTSLDTCHFWHDLQLCVQRRSAGSAKEVLVDLSRIPLGVVFLWLGRRRDLERGTRDDNVGGVSAAGPFLAIDAVAERGDCRLALGWS